MATNVASIQNYVNQYIHDSSTNSVTASDRVQAINDAVRSVYNEFGFNQTNKTYTLSFFDTVNTYNITSVLPDFLEPVDLRRQSPDNLQAFTRMTPRDISVNIDLYGKDQRLVEESFAVEQVNGNRNLIINHISKYSATDVNDCESLTDNGTWTIDQVNSWATNLVLDTVNFQSPFTASLSFDLKTSQGANNYATIYNPTMQVADFTQFYNVASFILWIYLPSTSNFNGLSVYWGSDTSATPATKANYWSNSITSDINGNPWTTGWVQVAIPWLGSTKTGSPDITKIRYLQFNYNFASSPGNLTSYHIDGIRIVRPELLTLHYQSWSVGTSVTGTTLYAFSTTTDVPFYSSQYDFFDVYAAHFAASMLFAEMGLMSDAESEMQKAEKEKGNLKKKFPSQMLKQTKNFGVKGINFRRRHVASNGTYYGS